MKKAIVFFLTAAMFMPSLFSCGSGEAAEESETVPQTAETTVESETELTDSLPERDFGGADFRVWCDTWTYEYFYDPELTGDVVEDAAYNRNKTVEERFNIQMVFDYDATRWRDQNLVINSVMAGSGAFDMVTGVGCYLTNPAIAGCYYDLTEAEYLDIDKPWYAQYVLRNLYVGDVLLLVSGYYDMPTVARAQVTYYNTEMAEDFGIEGMYDMVFAGDWTFDIMLSLGESVAADLNGDGKWTEADRYGITSQWDVLGLIYPTSGYSTMTSIDGSLRLSGYDENLIAANDMLYTLMYDTDYYYSGYTKGQAHNYENMLNVFLDKRALFFLNSVSYTSDELMRDMGTYGILPIPKFREDQEHYGAHSSAFASAIPMDVPDFAMSTIVLEALEYSSWKTVLPAYYDTALSKKFLNDEESVQILDLIFQNVCFDFTYAFHQFFGVDLALSVGLHENYVSWYTSQQSANEAKIEELQKSMEKFYG